MLIVPKTVKLKEIEVDLKELERILIRLIRIPTINANETKIAEYVKHYLELEGINAEIIESAPDRGNLVAQLGRGKRTIIFVSHSDVVPAGDEKKWDYPPFSGIKKGFLIYGRGAFDNKGQLVSQLYAIILAKRSRLDINGKVKLAIFADEEGQDYNHGARFMIRNHWDKVKADLAIGEGGGLIKIGKKFYQTIGIGERGGAVVEVNIASEDCGHIGFYKSNNIALKILKFVKSLRCNFTYYSPEVLSTLKSIFPKPLRSKLLMTKLLHFMKIVNKNSARLIDELLKIKIIPSKIIIGEKDNMFPCIGRVILNIRLLPSFKFVKSMKLIESSLRKSIGELTTDIRVKRYIPPTVNREPLKYYNFIERTVNNFEYNPLKVIIPSSTDLTWFRLRGVEAYSFFPTAETIDFYLPHVHNYNERISLFTLKLATIMYLKLIKIFLGGEMS